MPVVTLTDKSLSRKKPATGQLELFDTVVPGFGLRISYGGRRTFFVMCRVDKRLVRRTLGTTDTLTLAAAREKARAAKSAAAAGIDPNEVERRAKVEAARSKRWTFRAVAEEYLADMGEGGGGALKTRDELQRKLDKDVFPHWGDRPIKDITRSDVRDLVKAKANLTVGKVAKGESSPVAANRVLALVRRIFAWALNEERIDASPAFKIPKPGGKEKARSRVLSLEELRRIWNGCEGLGYPFGPLIQLLITTAQRKKEVAALHRDELEGAVWVLAGERAKNDELHLVPLSDLALEVLAKAPTIGPKGGLVFTTGRRRAKPVDGEELAPAPVSGWSRLKRRLDVAIARTIADELEEELDLTRHALAPWTLHDIRRSVSTHLRSSSVMGEGNAVSRLTVKMLLNHSQGDGATEIYDRYDGFDEKKAALDAWGERVKRLVGLNVIELPSGEARA